MIRRSSVARDTWSARGGAEIIALHGSEIDGRRLTIGRLFHTKRRWSWAERWEKSLAPTTFEDGCRFVPVEFATT